MKLIFEVQAPLAADEDIAQVSRIVAGVQDGWHEWFAPDPDHPNLETYYTQNPLHRELLSKSFTATRAYGSMGARTVTVTVGSGCVEDPDTWPLDEAVVYLSQPLEILVENARNDGDFFIACWDNISHRLAGRLASKRPGVSFSQGGGKAEIRLLVEHRVRLALVRHNVPPRLFLLIDSDSKYPGHETSESRQLRDLCAELGLGISILRKRAIENYVSDAALNDFSRSRPDSADAVGFLTSLSPEQRDHYPVKKGFEGDCGDPILGADGERALYQGVIWPSDHRPKIARLMSHVLGNTGLLSRENLADRGALYELQAIATQIDEEA